MPTSPCPPTGARPAAAPVRTAFVTSTVRVSASATRRVEPRRDPLPCLWAFVRASWITRYAARSTTGASGRGAPVGRESTTSPVALRVVEQPVERGRARGSGSRGRRRPVRGAPPRASRARSARSALASCTCRSAARAASGGSRAASRRPRPAPRSPRRGARARRAARARCAGAPRRPAGRPPPRGVRSARSTRSRAAAIVVRRDPTANPAASTTASERQESVTSSAHQSPVRSRSRTATAAISAAAATVPGEPTVPRHRAVHRDQGRDRAHPTRGRSRAVVTHRATPVTGQRDERRGPSPRQGRRAEQDERRHHGVEVPGSAREQTGRDEHEHPGAPRVTPADGTGPPCRPRASTHARHDTQARRTAAASQDPVRGMRRRAFVA